MAYVDSLLRDLRSRRKRRRPLGLSTYDAKQLETLAALEAQEVWLLDKIRAEHKADRSALDLIEKYVRINREIIAYRKSIGGCNAN